MTDSRPPPKRNTGPNALRRGRASVPHANYFVTVCVNPRRDVLIPVAATALLDEAQRLTTDGAWILRCLTVMPDHAHLFFTLGERLTLSRAVARFKTKTQAFVRLRGTDWQDNFYDHQLRADDSVESIIRYIQLNPYQAGLVQWPQTWPHFYCRDEDWEWFRGLTDRGLPIPEWLQ
jgi:REP element-mobilizing transposase RayT